MLMRRCDDVPAVGGVGRRMMKKAEGSSLVVAEGGGDGDDHLYSLLPLLIRISVDKYS